MFACQNIPSTDLDSDTYSCGSKNLNQSLYVISGCLLFWVIIFFLICIYHYGSYSFSATINEILEYYLYFSAIEDVNSSSPNIVKFDWLLKKTVICISLVCLLGFLLCIPVFVLKVTHGYVSFDHSYSWIVSLAYTSGMKVSILVLVAWTTLLVAGVWIVFVIKNKNCVLQPSRETNTKFSASTEDNYLNKRSSSTISVSFFRLSMIAEWKYYAAMVLFFNALVMLGVNALYVYCYFLELDNSTIQIIQVLFALFTLFWNHIVMARLTLDFSESLSRRITLKMRVKMFSSVIAPVLVLLVTDPDCFRVSNQYNSISHSFLGALIYFCIALFVCISFHTMEA
jgi:hypothetical protein